MDDIKKGDLSQTASADDQGAIGDLHAASIERSHEMRTPAAGFPPDSSGSDYEPSDTEKRTLA